MDEITSLVEDVLASLEKDSHGNYLVMVYVPDYGTYEWLPVTEELAELLTLLENQINGERKTKDKKRHNSRKEVRKGK